MPGLPRRGTRPGAPRKDAENWNRLRRQAAAREKAKDRWTLALEAGVPPAEVEVWRELMDPALTGTREFIETVFSVKRQSDIDWDAEEELDWDDDWSESDAGADLYVPFELRPAQLAMWTAIEGQWTGVMDPKLYQGAGVPPQALEELGKRKRRGHAARVINLKARQHGMSTFGMALMAERVLRRLGDGSVICQDTQSTREMGQKVREFIGQVPSWALPEEDKDATDGVRYVHDGGKSSIRFLTAGKHALGRSMTNHWLWISEYAWWPESAKAEVRGLLNTTQGLRGCFIVIECTAKGYDDFYRRWDSAMRGRSPFIPLFCNWRMHPDYRIRVPDESREELEATIGKLERYGGAEEVILRDQHGATLEHLYWRRMEIEGSAGGHLPTFHQEFPTVPEEAFISTGRPVFDLEVLKAWLPLAMDRTDKAKRGDMVIRGVGMDAHAEFQERRDGEWEVYEPRVVGEWYCWAADVASGHETLSDGRTEADYSSYRVLHGLTGRTVAKLRAHIDPIELATEVAKANLYYGMAMGLPEANMDGGEMISRLTEEEIGDNYLADTVMQTERIVRIEGVRTKAKQYGFKTTVKTKGPLIGHLRQFIHDLGLPKYGEKPSTWKDCPFDENTVQECLKYVKHPTTMQQGRTSHMAMSASSGHDDDVISMALALRARHLLWDDAPRLTRVTALKSDDPMDPFLEHLSAMHAKRSRSEGRRGYPEMGEFYR